MQILRQLDVHPKVREEADILVRTFSGAVVTIISTIIMGILFLSEVNYYLTPTLSEELFVDTSRGSKLRINLDIIVPSISCDLLSIDAMDTTGEQHLQIEHNIFKRRLDLTGKPIEDPQRTDITDTKALSKTTEKVTKSFVILLLIHLYPYCSKLYQKERKPLFIACGKYYRRSMWGLLRSYQ